MSSPLQREPHCVKEVSLGLREPFFRFLHSRLSPRGRLRAYADDIGMVLANLLLTGPGIAHAFGLFAHFTGLTLAPTKCVLIPLWPISVADLHRLLVEHIPLWRDFALALEGRYLGFILGPGITAESSWRKPLTNLSADDPAPASTAL